MAGSYVTVLVTLNDETQPVTTEVRLILFWQQKAPCSAGGLFVALNLMAIDLGKTDFFCNSCFCLMLFLG